VEMLEKLRFRLVCPKRIYDFRGWSKART